LTKFGKKGNPNLQGFKNLEGLSKKNTGLRVKPAMTTKETSVGLNVNNHRQKACGKNKNNENPLGERYKKNEKFMNNIRFYYVFGQF
jgi:hypothetical protein